MDRPTHYDILQVAPSADIEVIKAAYKQLALKHHPDTGKTTASDQKMQEINAAYKVLSDPLRRAQYDNSLKNISSFRTAVAARSTPSTSYPNQGASPEDIVAGEARRRIDELHRQEEAERQRAQTQQEMKLQADERVRIERETESQIFIEMYKQMGLSIFHKTNKFTDFDRVLNHVSHRQFRRALIRIQYVNCGNESMRNQQARWIDLLNYILTNEPHNDQSGPRLLVNLEEHGCMVAIILLVVICVIIGFILEPGIYMGGTILIILLVVALRGFTWLFPGYL